MPVFIYLVALFATVFSSAAGLTALAVLFAVATMCVLFRHELRQLQLPRIDFRRTDP